METTDRYRRSLKRKNCSAHTVKAYMNILAHFTRWLEIPLTEVTRNEMGSYVDHLLARRLGPKTIICHLQTIRLFFDWCINEEEMTMVNPVHKISIRLPKPLPRDLKYDQVGKFFALITDLRDRALFMLMLRCGLRVEEVAHLTMDAVELARNRLFVAQGKGGKDRVVFLSEDARAALEAYLAKRSSKVRSIFLVQKGPMSGRPLSVRGIQKRIEYYARESGVTVSCHCLRHTMATQLLNADADLSSIQDLLGHAHVTTTQRYCRVSNLKVQRDYYAAIERVMQRSQEERAQVKAWPSVRSERKTRRTNIRLLVAEKKELEELRNRRRISQGNKRIASDAVPREKYRVQHDTTHAPDKGPPVPGTKTPQGGDG